jgi:hypothetical protein
VQSPLYVDVGLGIPGVVMVHTVQWRASRKFPRGRSGV